MKRSCQALLLTICALQIVISVQARAATCEAFGFDSLVALLQDVNNCPHPNIAGHRYIELRTNTYIDKALVIPDKTTLKGNLVSDPGKPATLESNFVTDFDSYQSGFTPFKKPKPSPPDCLITIENDSTLENISLTKVYAKTAICIKSTTKINGVEIQGPSLDMSIDFQNAFFGIAILGSNNVLSGITYSISKGHELSFADGSSNNTFNKSAQTNSDKKAEDSNKEAAAQDAKKLSCTEGTTPDNVNNVCIKNNVEKLNCPAGTTADFINNVCIKLVEKPAPDIGKDGNTPIGPTPFGPPPVANASGGGNCTLMAGIEHPATPIATFLMTITLTGLIAFRSQRKAKYEPVRHKKRDH